jgi:hypothetical protein
MKSMNDQANQEGGPSSARGDAAWREDLERVAERNRAVRKAGKQQREADERQRDGARRAAERQRTSKLLAGPRGRSSSR